MFPQSFLDDLRLQANILQVVQEYVPLKRSGRTYKGLCPFHSEKTPSFHVDPEKGFFHCFGCQAGGDVIKFVELHEKLAFPEAVRLLAQKAGLSLPEAAGGEESRQDAGLRESLLKIHELALGYFQEQLASPAGARARQLLTERGLPPKTVEALGLGFAPGVRDGLETRLSAQGFSGELLLQSGLVVQRDANAPGGENGTHGRAKGGELVDRFRSRLMIPIFRDAGSIIAFGGRAMLDGQVPKYLNSPETPIYSKSRTLYGLNLSKAAIRKLGFAVIVEGYFDFAQVFQSGAAPAVASCGTALTQAQAQLLRRFTSRVVLSFDPDAAGQGAAIRSCDMLVAEGFEVNVLVLDRGEDPDTFIRRHGAEAYRQRLKTSRPYLEYLLDQAAAGVDFAHAERRRQFLERMLGVAARIPDVAARDQFGDRIAHRARVSEDVVRAEIRKAAVQRRTQLTARELPSLGQQLKYAEKGLIWALVHNSRQGFEALADLDEDDVSHLAGRAILEAARALSVSLAPDAIPAALLQRLSTEDARLVASVAASATAPAPPIECARALKRMRCERERAALQREIDRLQELGAGEHDVEIDALWRKKKDLLHRIEQLT
ncbi:MAG: DNA primase [Vicinamibacterales bacterium]